MTLVGTLQDDFNDNSVSSAKWPSSFGTFSETGGRARVACDTGFSAYASAAAYTLQESHALCRIFPPALGGATVEAYAQLLVRTTTMGTDAGVTVERVSGRIFFASRVGFTDAGEVSLPYDPLQHAYVRIREEGGSLTWATSPDKFIWTVRRTAASPSWVSNADLQVLLLSHRNSGVNDFAEFDDFNTDSGYRLAVDWGGDGFFTGSGEDSTGDVLDGGRWTFGYGRDQTRQLSPGSIGRSGFTVCNADRIYSPENTSSPLHDFLQPGRRVTMEASVLGEVYPLFRGRLDDFSVTPDRANRTAEFTALDDLYTLQNRTLSTAVYAGQRTGTLIGTILDEVGWPADQRNIDAGGTFVPWWWIEGQDALSAIQDLVASEGPPAIAYIAPDGVFTFKDRHHRLIDPASTTSQAAFAARRVACDVPAVTGFSYTDPFVYEHGWRDVVNTFDETIPVYTPDPAVSVVWLSEDPFTLATLVTTRIQISANGAFINAITPTAGPPGSGADIIFTGGGVIGGIVLSRTSGQSAVLTMTAVGGNKTVLSVRLRAFALPQSRSARVQDQDPGAVFDGIVKTYPVQITWSTVNDLEAVGEAVIGRYSTRKPIVRVRTVSRDDPHLLQVLTRTISDRVTIRNGELGLDGDFFIERVDHTISRVGDDSQPFHALVMGCEKSFDEFVANPFTFDKAGAGFNDGFFGAVGLDNPASVWIWGTQSRFSVNEFGT